MTNSTPISGTTLRVRIAEAQGWHSRTCSDTRFTAMYNPSGRRMGSTETPDERWWCYHIPDYPNDLNLCAQFEAGLTPQQSESYAFHLMEGMSIPHALRNNWRCYFVMMTATARQRCLAYLATINPEEGK